MKRRMALLVATVAVLGLVAASPAFGLTGADFGSHVSSHAQMMGGFSAAMNPGTHQGFLGRRAGM